MYSVAQDIIVSFLSGCLFTILTFVVILSITWAKREKYGRRILSQDELRQAMWEDIDDLLKQLHRDTL